MDTKEFLIVKRDDRYWIFLQKSPPDLENGDPLHAVLRWIIEQLHLGMYRTKSDEQGDRCTLVIGRAASHHLGSIEEAEKHARDSLLHLNISSLLAKAREEGSRPETVELVEQATVTRTAWAQLSTEFHQPFELVDTLRRLRDTTFDFTPPGIIGNAPDEVVFHLRKATRCFLYGLFDPSAALCKECLEEALKTKLFASTQGIEALVKEPKRTDRGTPRGELERFISAGAAIALLDGPSRTSADQIRQHGNQVMHDRPVLKEAEARQDLDDVRGVLNQLFAW